jgi:predicted transcriptional regulator
MPSATRPVALTKRERQIMDALYRLGRATANQLLAEIPGTTTSSTIRTQLRVLEEKGHVRHEGHGLRYVYSPTVPRHAARRTAVRHLIDTFFDGSPVNLLASLLGRDAARLTDEDLERLTTLIDSSRGQPR